MSLEFNSLDEVPEALRSDFSLHDGKFIPTQLVGLMGENLTLSAAKKQGFDQYHSTKRDFDSVTAQLADYKNSESARETKIREETEAQLRKDGKFDELIKLEQEGRGKDLEDFEKRLGESSSNWEAKLAVQTEAQNKLQGEYETLQTNGINKDKKLLASKIAGAYAAKAFVNGAAKLLMLERMKVVEGQVVFTDANGNAMSIDDMAVVKESLEKDDTFAGYAAAPDSSGGMGKGGSDKGGERKELSRSEFAALNPVDKAEKMKQGYKLT